ncbi:histone-lysine N-methyltransferase SMYD3-like [Antedon mediterranea]|uniref:histone-lysine N-methyltransferase SMYD3-like n=1 Tax=Antedon mediterranea TaxID=105859 RepID=UPI003AF66EDC
MAAVSRFDVRIDKTRGKCAFAACDLIPGDEILTDVPYVFSLRRAQRRCDYCCSYSDKLLRCSKCKLQSYCDRSCQRSAWKVHKEECKNLQRVGNRPSQTVLLMARLVQVVKADSGYQNGGFNLPCGLHELQSNHKQFSERARGLVIDIMRCLGNYLGIQNVPSYPDMLELFGRVACNSFNICDKEMQSIGVGLYLKAAIFNHSCSPNCIAVFNSTTLHMRAVKNIKKGEELLVSYIDLMYPTEIRQQMLQDQYFFTCDCTACQERVNDGQMGSIVCQKCSGQILRKNRNSFQLCSECGAEVSTIRSSEITELEEDCKKVLDDSESHLVNLNHLAADNDESLIIQLSRRLEGTLHTQHFYWIHVLNKLADIAICQQNWRQALKYCEKATPPTIKYYPCYHPLAGVQLCRLAKLYDWLDNYSEAIKYIQQAIDIIGITHGKQHTFYEELQEHKMDYTYEAKFDAINQNATK